MTILNKRPTTVTIGSSRLTRSSTDSTIMVGGQFEGVQPVNVAIAADVEVNISTAKAGDTLQGYILKLNDKVLLPNQSIAGRNGVYNVGASSLTIDRFIGDKFELNQISEIHVQAGTNAKQVYIQTTRSAAFNGTTFTPALAFEKNSNSVVGTDDNLVMIQSNGLVDSGKKIDDTQTTANNLWTASQVAQYVTSQLLNVPSLPDVAFTTTANDTRSGLSARDGYTPLAGDYALVKNQTIAGQNGIYKVASGGWVRQVYNSTLQVYEDLTTETTYDELNINGGVVNVRNGTINKNLQFQFYIPVPTGLISSNDSDVIVTAQTKLPVASPNNRFVDTNVGNDTLFNGTNSFPFKTITKALQGMSFPATITISSSGSAETSSHTFTSGQSNLVIQGQDKTSSNGTTALSGQFTFGTANTRVDFQAVSLTNTGAPFSFASGATYRNHFSDIVVHSVASDWLGLDANATNWITLDNIMFANALATSVNLPAFNNAFTIHINKQITGLLKFTGTGSANTTININSSVDGLVWIPSTFLGTINFVDSAWGNVLGSTARPVGIINNQVDLTNILGWNTDSTYDGWYLINFASPTSFAGNAIFGKRTIGGVTFTYWGRTAVQAPATVSDFTNTTYAKTNSGYVAVGATPTQGSAYPLDANTSGTVSALIASNLVVDAQHNLYSIQNKGTSPIQLFANFTGWEAFRLSANVGFVLLYPNETAVISTTTIGTHYRIVNISHPHKGVKMNWSRDLHDTNLAVTNTVSSGVTGDAAPDANTLFGYKLSRDNVNGSVGSMYWQVNNINWGAPVIRFRGSFCSVKQPSYSDAGDAIFMAIGGTTFATHIGTANSGILCELSYYLPAKRARIFDGSTLLREVTLTNRHDFINSAFVLSSNYNEANWHDFEVVFKRIEGANLVLLEMLINGSLVAQHELSLSGRIDSLGNFVTVGGWGGAASCDKFVRAVTVEYL